MTSTTTIFLGGDAMLGRGIDQILPCPGSPALFEPSVRDARRYVQLAEEHSGTIPRGAPLDYVWGEALDEIRQHDAALRVVNLETSVTRSDRFDADKAVHYRMSPGNAGCLSAADIDVCALANNHVLDWGAPGLEETLATLAALPVATAGAGRDLEEACRPRAIPLAGGGRVLVASAASPSSGAPSSWAASSERAGVCLFDERRVEDAHALARRLSLEREPGDLALASIHWESNWGYRVSAAQRRCAHALIEDGVDVVHGHSSHHVRPLEVYRGKLVLYGCGELVDDYEGIPGYERYRGDLVLLYFATLARDSGALVALRMTPMRISRLRLVRAASDEARFLERALSDSSAAFGTRFRLRDDGDLELLL